MNEEMANACTQQCIHQLRHVYDSEVHVVRHKSTSFEVVAT